jgi:multiple antibiotic resistance protein
VLEPLAGFAQAFVPLFVAVDPVGILPIYLGLTARLGHAERRPVAREAALTAAAVGIAFLLAGDAVLALLGASVGDLQVAGGLLLLVFAVHDLVHPLRPLREPLERVGVMPLGVPMIAGPAVLTALLMLARTHGHLATTLAFLVNLALVWVALRWATVIVRMLGTAGAHAFAKVASLLLAVIGVTLIRQGVAAAVASMTRGG